MLAIVRDELLQPDRLQDEMRRVSKELAELERQERDAMHQSPAGDELRRVEAKIKSVRSLNLGVAAEYAAVRELEAEREALAARAAKKLTPGLQEARQMLAQLPKIAAMFDTVRDKIGQRSRGGVRIHDVRQLRRIVRRERITIAVIAVPAEAAQSVVDTVVAAGIKAILNFSPGALKVPPDVKLKSVDLTVSLESLSFFLAQDAGVDHE